MRRRFFKTKKNNNIIDNYLTIEALEDGLYVKLSIISCEYCVDGSGIWVELPPNTFTSIINAGHTLSFRYYSDEVGDTFIINKKCNLKGNCLSMVFGDYASKNISLKKNNKAFYRLFANCNTIVKVDSDFLPAILLSYSCYSNMFKGCTNLVNAPELPATTLNDYCYSSMFEGCTNLNYIKMLATDISASHCLSNWVSGVSSTGTFVKSKDATWDVVGSSGVPTGWTVIDDTFHTNEDGFPESTEFSFPLYLNFPKEPYYEDEYEVEYILKNEITDSLREWVINQEVDDDSLVDKTTVESNPIFINGYRVVDIYYGVGVLEFYGIRGFDSVSFDGTTLLGVKLK